MIGSVQSVEVRNGNAGASRLRSGFDSRIVHHRRGGIKVIITGCDPVDGSSSLPLGITLKGGDKNNTKRN